jgi:hypothetical protein
MGYLDDILDRRTQLLQLRRDLANEILAARSVPGPRTTTGESLLSPSGLAQHRRELVDKVRAKYAPKLADLVEDVETRAKFLAGDAQRARPMPGSDAASQMALQRSWDQVRTRLDAGMPLRTVIDNADLDTLHAIREWAPSHLEAQAFHEHQRTGLHSTGSMIGITRTFQPPDLTWLTARIDERYAELAGGKVATALREGQQSAAAVAGFRANAQTLQLELEGHSVPGGPIVAGIAAHYAEQAAAGIAPDEDSGDAAPSASRAG